MLYLRSVMDAIRPGKGAADALETGRSDVDLFPCSLPKSSVHPCERCKCCSCVHVCTKCSRNCSPSDSYFIPVVACPDFIDMRTIEPVRYLYRSGCDLEYKLRLPRTR